MIHFVRKFIHNLKVRVNSKDNLCKDVKSKLTYNESVLNTVRLVQMLDFPGVVSHLCDPNEILPPIISKLNLFLDKNCIIRVKGKMSKLKTYDSDAFPILFKKDSPFTKGLILDFHNRLNHGGIFKILNLLRKQFYVPSAFTVVKKIIRDCTWCRRLHGRVVSRQS